MLQNKNTLTNAVINSTINVNGNFHIGPIFNDSTENTKEARPSIWETLKAEYKKIKQQHLLDVFFWDTGTGQLSHFIFNDSTNLNIDYVASVNALHNNTNQGNLNTKLKNAKVRLISIPTSEDYLIETYSQELRDFVVHIDANEFFYDDFGGLGRRKVNLTNWSETAFVDGGKISVQKLNKKDWFEYEIDTLRLNLLFNPDFVPEAYILRHRLRGILYLYIFLLKA